jgi:hypothetical protein
MDKLDSVVADHIEQRLLQPKRLEQILSSVADVSADMAISTRVTPIGHRVGFRTIQVRRRTFAPGCVSFEPPQTYQRHRSGDELCDRRA